MLGTTPILLAGALINAHSAPLDIFSGVCMEGTARFDSLPLKQVSRSAIPQEAVFQLNFVPFPDSTGPNHHEMSSLRLPSRVFEIGMDQTMFLAIPDETPSMDSKTLCAVFVEGDHYAEFKNFLGKFIGINAADVSAAARSMTIYADEHSITAVGEGQWTVMAAAVAPHPEAGQPPNSVRKPDEASAKVVRPEIEQ